MPQTIGRVLLVVFTAVVVLVMMLIVRGNPMMTDNMSILVFAVAGVVALVRALTHKDTILGMAAAAVLASAFYLYARMHLHWL